ncbi:unnamed protein product [Pleuronectes platessa]|uniref:Uncharacterized protein n=1 Tax=Pleuronectes platessa TaxID=8262 RepID=A0A9N7U257_PLEPL|nr:unnamed protein product [Pleuronectes platessa]
MSHTVIATELTHMDVFKGDIADAYLDICRCFEEQIEALQEVLEKLKSKQLPSTEKKLGWPPSVRSFCFLYDDVKEIKVGCRRAVCAA